MTNSKYSNDQTTDIVARSQGFDEGYAAGIKEGISMALAAQPPKDETHWRQDDPDINSTERYNEALDDWEAALLKLKKG